MRRWSLALVLILVACSTSPLGRKQLTLMPDSQMNSMGSEAFDQMKQKTPIEHDPAINAYVDCVAVPITVAAKDQLQVDKWEIVVFKDKEVNAFALPGGKIGVQTGLLPVAKTDAQLAAVLGHETGHVIAKHGNERVSQSLGESLVLAGAALSLSGDNPQRNLILGGLGLGMQVGVALPFSRTQESEADLIGLNLMARAGFDPRQAVELWKNMMASGGNAPPQILSDHPSDATRIQALQDHLPEAIKDYDAAQAAGLRPHCVRPAGI